MNPPKLDIPMKEIRKCVICEKWKKKEDMENKYKIGDKVSWKCNPYSANGYTFIAEGTIVEFLPTGAKIKVDSDEYTKRFPNRKTTTISLHNLK